MTTEILHQRESSEDTENHLQENIGKFESDAVFLLKLMLKGERLTAKTVMQKYGIHDRRLRDLEISGKCQKEWKVNEKGKRLYVEYFVSTPHPPTKTECIEKAGKIIEMMKTIPDKKLVTVFSLPDIPNDNKPESYHQQKLF